MSRHKLVKGLDLDEELNDFDGAAESDYDDELAPEDKEQLRTGTVKVRSILGDDIQVTSREIEDSLWHYYYDVEKTVNYLLSQKTHVFPKKPKQKSAKAGQLSTHDANEPLEVGSGIEYPFCGGDLETCLTSPCRLHRSSLALSGADFFKDSPWLNIPRDRRGEILVEPLHLKRGLLGGTSKQESAPKSKLAALAAARKKKENQRAEDGGSSTSSVAILDRLGGKPSEFKLNKESDPLSSSPKSKVVNPNTNAQTKKYPTRKPQDAKASLVQPSPKEASTRTATASTVVPGEQLQASPAASPSVFAQIMFGSTTKCEDSNPQSLDCPTLQALTTFTEFSFTGPSPDDVVLEAQNSKSQTQKPTRKTMQPTNDNGTSKDVAQGVKGLIIEDQKPKGKNLDVLAEFKKSKPKNAANFVVIGHVDAGKSTLMGRLLHDLKVVDTRTIDKYRRDADRLGKSSFALAWVLDQGTEERERGVTIDTAMKSFETQNTKFTILDAPGHRDFIPNMIAGASQADLAVLVIDASTGNFESGLRGQTKEHALLVRSMGVQRVIVAVNKLDTVQWSSDRFEEIVQQISAFLTSAGFLSKNLSYVPCAGITGENIVRKSENDKVAWYRGPTLLSLLESSEPIVRALENPLRLTIDDIFRGGVQNPLSISGRVDAGSLQTGDMIQIFPANQKATIKGLEVDSEPADWAVAGQNVILHLTDIEAKYLKSGDAIGPPSAPVECITSFTAKILAFEHIMPMQCEVNKGRLYAPARITRLVAQLDKVSGAIIKGKKPRLIKPGTVARVFIEVDTAIPLEQGSRVVIRVGGETVGTGLVE